MQFYTNPTRENDPHALPDAETFYVSERAAHRNASYPEAAGGPIDSGWYWWPCFPGCLPDSDPIGPFDSEDAAIADARECAS